MEDELDLVEESELDELLEEEEVEQAEGCVRFIAAGGFTRDVYVGDESTDGLPGVPLGTVLTRGSLTFNPNTQFMVDGAYVGLDYLVQPGAVVTAAGVLKGG
jgi:hypothetical protein